MSQASEGIAKQFSNAIMTNKVWGGIVVNVKAYGAEGDGETDDTKAIQTAIDAAIDAGKLEVTFPAGTYNYGVLTDTAGITFIGDGVTLNGTTPISLVNMSQLADTAKKLGAWVDVTEKPYNAKGDGVTDDTVAVQTAMNAAGINGIVYLPSKNTFMVDMLVVPSNLTITGGGTLKFKNNTTSFTLLKLDLADNVTIDGVVFDGNIAGQTTWSDARHTIIMYGSTNITIKNCTFKNLIGDGIYVSHNGDLTLSANVNIHNNRFIGNNTNRNGISVIHCKDSMIHHNYFNGMSRNDMPGSIDLEPNQTTETITGVIVESNRIIGTGTPNLQKAISVANAGGGTVNDISIINNKITGIYRYAIAAFGDASNTDRTQATIKGNTLISTVTYAESAAIIISKGFYDIAENNINSTADYGIKILGGNFKISANRVRNAAKYGIEELGAALDFGKIEGNVIEDCGTNAAGSLGGIHITGSYLDIVNNRVTSSATTKTQFGLYITSGVKNYIAGNVFKGMGARALSISTAPQMFGQNMYDNGFNTVSGTYPPTSETWVEGDTIYLPTAEGYIYTCVARGTPGTWSTRQAKHLTSISANPIFAGQEALVAGIWYKAKGTTSAADWVALN